MVYIVCLDIRSEGPARDSVIAAIKTLGNWAGRFPDMMLLRGAKGIGVWLKGGSNLWRGWSCGYLEQIDLEFQGNHSGELTKLGGCVFFGA